MHAGEANVVLIHCYSNVSKLMRFELINEDCFSIVLESELIKNLLLKWWAVKLYILVPVKQTITNSNDGWTLKNTYHTSKEASHK